jgi:hypothetical protein
MIARILFGEPSDWSHRHPRLMICIVVVLILLSQWLVDLAIPPLELP